MEDLNLDVSQLMAFADSLEDPSIPGEYTWAQDFDTNEPSGHDDSVEATLPWSCPAPMYNQGAYTSTIRMHRKVDVGDAVTEHTPRSPVAKHRTTLFRASEKIVDLDVATESADPRCVCVIDHPGRHAQFKHWLQVGQIGDEVRRLTIREESARPTCWLSSGANGLKSAQDPTKGVLGILLPGKPSDTRVAEVSDLIATLRKSAASEPNFGDPRDPALDVVDSHAMWKERSFLVGNHIMVAMKESGLTDERMKGWCVWFNDLLCAWGLADRASQHSPQLTTVDADIDFSGNMLSDMSVKELKQLLSAFRRVHLRTLRVNGNLLTDDSLEILADMPYLTGIFMDDNSVTRAGLMSYIIRSRHLRVEHHQALQAQDREDGTLLQPNHISISGNLIHDTLDFLYELQHAGLVVCCSESAGCDLSSGTCRLYGQRCDVHLSGIGAQRNHRIT